MIMYKANIGWRTGIERREVLRVTDKTVTYAEQRGWGNKKGEARESLVSSHHSWHPTWQEAKTTLVDYYARRLESVKKSALAVAELLSEAEALTESEPTE